MSGLEQSLSKEQLSFIECNPGFSAILEWILGLSPDWQDINSDDLTEAKEDVLMKLGALEYIQKRTTTRFSLPGSDDEAAVVFDSCGFDRIDEFLRRDVFPAIPALVSGESNGVLPRHEPIFKARLARNGQALAGAINLAIPADCDAEERESAITELIDLSGLIAHRLSHVCRVSQVRFAKLKSLEITKRGNGGLASIASGWEPMGPAAVAIRLGITTSTVNTFARAAGVSTPGRGKKNHTYSADDCMKIANRVAKHSTVKADIAAAKAWISEADNTN